MMDRMTQGPPSASTEDRLPIVGPEARQPRRQTFVGCPRCDGVELARECYSELLGWYLGDGHITLGRRGVYALHIINDQRYSEANARLLTLMGSVKPGGRPHSRKRPGAIVTTTYWKHWVCLFPQHGPGRKHERPIVLEGWQREIVEAHPAAFLRGLFHSDGSRVNNWARRPVAGVSKLYEYPRWPFSNVSEDILQLCCWALDQVDVAWRRSSPKHVSVSRREAVARLDELIGLKS